MIVLDTFVVSEAMKAQAGSRAQVWLDGQRTADLFITATTLAELRLGIEILPPSQRRNLLSGALDRVLTQTLQNRILPFDEEAARAYGRLVSRARAVGRTIRVADGQIAAIAAVQGFLVATRDVGPFVVAGVGVVNPWEG